MWLSNGEGPALVNPEPYSWIIAKQQIYSHNTKSDLAAYICCKECRFQNIQWDGGQCKIMIHEGFWEVAQGGHRWFLILF